MITHVENVAGGVRGHDVQAPEWHPAPSCHALCEASTDQILAACLAEEVPAALELHRIFRRVLAEGTHKLRLNGGDGN